MNDHEHSDRKDSLSLWGAVSMGTGVMIGAGAGVFTRIMIHETMGVALGTGENMTPENIAANWDAISDMSDARALYQGGEQTIKIFEQADKN